MPQNSPQQVISLTSRRCGEHNVASYAAAIAYHTIISLAPLLLVAISIAGRFFTEEQALTQLNTVTAQVTGTAMADVITSIAQQLNSPTSNNFAFALFWFVVMLYAGSNVFRQLVVALDTIWEVPYQPIERQKLDLVWGITQVRKYLVGLTMTLCAIISLPILLLVGVVVNNFWELMDGIIDGASRIVPLVNFVLIPSVLILFCLLVFKFVPSKRMELREIWVGATLTGLVLAVAEVLIGVYASLSSIPAFYGVAGSIVILMLWAYFSAYILLVGAEFTYVWGNWGELE